MPVIKINDRQFECGAIIFDKDGTLIDFHRIWGCRAHRAVTDLVVAVGESWGDRDQLKANLFRTIGYDPESGKTSGVGPLATAPLEKLYVVMATVLHQHGVDWDTAEQLANTHARPAMSAIPVGDELEALADIRALFASLADAGIRLAVATTDNRTATEAFFDHLKVRELVEVLLCGDDAHCEPKPSPLVLKFVSEHFDVPASHIAIVGDTIGDMLTGINGNAGLKVGVAGGASSIDQLRRHADVIIDSVAAIQLVSVSDQPSGKLP